MSGRIARAFADAAAQGRPAVIAYVMSGDPSPDAAFAYANAVLAEADVLEVGVPFSDPVADGPVIERAAVRALARGHTLAQAFALVKRLRAVSTKPILLMTYYNPVFVRGVERFAREAAEAGADGVILPDVPLEESGDAERACTAHGLSLVQLASPATPDERLRRLAKATRGFLYVVSSFGVTGARRDIAPETRALVARSREACAGLVPVVVGFGVSEPEHVRALHEAGADGIVVGSAIVGRIEQGEPPERVAAYVRSLCVSK